MKGQTGSSSIALFFLQPRHYTAVRGQRQAAAALFPCRKINQKYNYICNIQGVSVYIFWLLFLYVLVYLVLRYTSGMTLLKVALFPVRIGGTQYTWSFMSMRAGRVWCEKSQPRQDSIPGSSSPLRVATLTYLRQPIL